MQKYAIPGVKLPVSIMYFLIQDPKMKEFVYQRCRKAVRLMLCSNAPLPTELTNQWRNITGHSILQSFSKPVATGCHPSYVKLLKQRRSSVAWYVLSYLIFIYIQIHRFISSSIKSTNSKLFYLSHYTIWFMLNYLYTFLSHSLSIVFHTVKFSWIACLHYPILYSLR